MPSAREVIVPAVWADFYEETRIPAAVRVGDTLRVTGHTGETTTASSPSTPKINFDRFFGILR